MIINVVRLSSFRTDHQAGNCVAIKVFYGVFVWCVFPRKDHAAAGVFVQSHRR